MGYLSIDNLYNNNEIMMFRECYALEKIDGTTSWVQWSNGHVSYHAGGANRDAFIALFDHEKLTQIFSSMEYPSDITVRIHGEAYGGKIQAMSKTYGQKLCFTAFDVRVGESWLNVPKAEEYCLKFGIEFVPYERIETTEQAMDRERDRDSIIAIRRGMGEGHIREGVILRPIKEVKFNNGSRCIAKHKRAEFRETRKVRTLKSAEEKKAIEDAQEIAEEWCVPQRLKHVIGKMTVNEVEPDMSMVGDIIKNMISDIYRESNGEVQESREVAKAIGTQTVKLYKEYLRKKMMESR